MSRPATPSYEFGPFCLNLSEHMLLRDGHPLPLTPKHFDVLRVLVENSGHLVEKERLLKEVWPNSFVEEGALNRSVSVLRKTLGERPSEQKYIETVPKLGYRFVAPVTERLQDHAGPIVESHEHPTVIETADRGSPTLPTTVHRARPAAPPSLLQRTAGTAGALLAVGALSYVILAPGEPPRPGLVPAHRQVTFTGKEGAPTMSPDGRRIAYVSDETPQKKVMVQELAGGQPNEVFSAPEVGHMRWSPDGAQLLLWARGSEHDGIYIMPQLGGALRRIARGQFVACWSPDGSTIAVGSYLGGKISFRNTEGQLQRTISLRSIQGSIWAIDWSAADGRLMVVSSDYQGRYTIWTVKPDGSDQMSVLEETDEIPTARWAAQGNAIYYLRRRNQTNSIYKVFLRSGHDNDRVPTPLVTGLETDRSFALSADGNRLVYARAPYHSNLWTLEVGPHGTNHGTDARALTQGTSLIERPRVSPDGTSIVFNMGHEPVTHLYTMPITGGSPKQITFLDSLNVGGVWSADGQRIAFASTEGGKPRIWIVEAGGGTPRALSSGDLSDSLDLTWSAGARILYQQAGNRNYYEVDPETREERLLARDSSVGWMFSPAYSPDGRYVAVHWNRRPNRGIWLIDTRNGRETFLYQTSATTSAFPVAWSSDGSSVYALEGKPSTYRGPTLPVGETMTGARIVMVPVNGGDAKTVASFPFAEIGGVSMTPDGRRFVFTVYSTRSDVWVMDNFDVTPDPKIARRQ